MLHLNVKRQVKMLYLDRIVLL